MPIHNRIKTVDWQFSEEPNILVLTSRQVVDDKQPVLRVSRDAEGSWSFMSGQEFAMSDVRFVTLDSMVSLDPSLHEAAHTPINGAVNRPDADAPWEISESP